MCTRPGPLSNKWDSKLHRTKEAMSISDLFFSKIVCINVLQSLSSLNRKWDQSFDLRFWGHFFSQFLIHSSPWFYHSLLGSYKTKPGSAQGCFQTETKKPCSMLEFLSWPTGVLAYHVNSTNGAHAHSWDTEARSCSLESA